MILRFCSGSLTPGETPQEEICGLRVDQRDVVVIAEQRNDFVRLACTHQTGIDEDAGELIADRFVDENGRDG